MSEVLLKNVQEMLNEEKWTRATLSNYSTNQFKELDVLLKESREKRADDELKALCDEHLTHTKNSIIALYLSGMIALSRQIIDDSALINLVSIFVDNHKWGIVKYLCERILDYGESKFALRTLADCYKNDNEEEAMRGVQERLVKVDYEEADLAKTLGDRYDEEAKLEEAEDYYKKALHRYVNKGVFTNVREIWLKLIEYNKGEKENKKDLDFFLHFQKKVAKNISKEKAALLLNDVYNLCREDNDIETAIGICKLILQYDERDEPARKEITDCFRIKYADHSQLEEYVRISNLTQKWRNVHEAITDFEKHIAFDRGNFVYHRTWGIGRIARVQSDKIIVDFAKRRDHSMDLKMALNALQIISKNHIWVLKATKKKEELHDKVKKDPAWALKTVIRSFNNSCDIKHIKTELVPDILSAGEWATWSSNARDILKKDPNFGVSPDNIDVFTVRDRLISKEHYNEFTNEKLYNEFKAERKFFERADIIRNYAAQKNVELDSEYFTEMFGYFTAYLRTKGQITEQVAASYLLVKDLVARFPHLGAGLSLNFAEMFRGIEDVPSLLLDIKDPKLREEFLRCIQVFIPDWPDIFIKLFPYVLSASIIDALKKGGLEDKLVVMTRYCFENYRDHRESREAALWLLKNHKNDPWFAEAGLSQERQLIILVHILNIAYRDIENRRDTTENRKINKQAYTMLFKEDLLNNFIDQADVDAILRVYTLIDDVKDLDPGDKLSLRNRILQIHPSFKFLGDTERTTVSRGLLVTMVKFEEKQRELARIVDVEIPQNSKEIGFAISLGDLRENAEYKAAKEKQDLLNTTAAKLKDEIERAQLFDPASVNVNRVSFGTRALLVNHSNGESEAYTILGPWESDPDNRIISYLSPLGGALLNKKPGEQFDFSINDEKVSYTVREITAAEL